MQKKIKLTQFQHKCIDISVIVCTILIPLLGLSAALSDNMFLDIIFFLNYIIALLLAIIKNLYLHEIF